MYQGARVTDTTMGFGSGGNTSADAELMLGLDRLRARSRQMVRDSSYAKRIRTVIVNNVIGSGVGMQAQVDTTRGGPHDRINAGIEDAMKEWSCADACHTGGSVHFGDLERLLLGEVFEAGEVLVRKHYQRFGMSEVPLGLEVIESERLAGDIVDPGTMLGLSPGAQLRMGVECDSFQRPLAYWIRKGHPGDVRGFTPESHRYERVPASDILHLRLVDRWPQTRGVPWLHTALRKLDDLNEYSQNEVTAARASAAYFGTIESDEQPDLKDPNGSINQAPAMNIDPLTVQQLGAGEKFTFHTPNRPNSALDPFMRAMLREICAGSGPSYASVSRDYSQSTYSSERVAQLDDRDMWRVLQQWWIRSFRAPLHKAWLQQAVLAGAVEGLPVSLYAADTCKYECVTWKPRGWQWVDPTKEVNAFETAVRCGFTTLTDVIAQTAGGQDLEDFIAKRKRELEMLEEAGIEVDTTVIAGVAPPPKSPAIAPGAPAAAASDVEDAVDAADPAAETETETDPAATRVHLLRRAP
jgi:lambda family phage portal protein